MTRPFYWQPKAVQRHLKTGGLANNFAFNCPIRVHLGWALELRINLRALRFSFSRRLHLMFLPPFPRAIWPDALLFIIIITFFLFYKNQKPAHTHRTEEGSKEGRKKNKNYTKNCWKTTPSSSSSSFVRLSLFSPKRRGRERCSGLHYKAVNLALQPSTTSAATKKKRFLWKRKKVKWKKAAGWYCKRWNKGDWEREKRFFHSTFMWFWKRNNGREREKVVLNKKDFYFLFVAKCA